MIIVTVALAAVVAVVVSLSGPGEGFTSQAIPVEPVAAETKEKPEKEKEFDPGQKLEIERKKSPEEPRKKPEQAPPAEPEPRKAPPAAEPEPVETPPVEPPPPSPPPPVDSGERPEPSGEEPEVVETPPIETLPVETLPVEVEDWPEPSEEEAAAVEAPRYYAPLRDSSLALTIENIGLYNVPVTNAKSQQALDQGVIHYPQSPMPWDEREQKNVYLAGHRLGWPGTGSRLVFYNLDKLKRGDSIMLRDSLGNPYEYRVSEVFVVSPDAVWAVDPVRGRDMLTLQTCTLPDLQNRIIVRADRV